MLLARRANRGPVFTYGGDSIKIIKTTWASSLRRSGIRHFRFHDLRHTANTRMMLAGVLQEVRREILGHSSQRSRDINDRYTQIELPEKREAIRKLEVWLESQALLLQTADATPLLLKSGDPTTITKEQPDDDSQHATSAALELDDALRKLVLKRATEINARLLARITTVADDLDAGRHRAALSGIDGIERQDRDHAQSLAPTSVGVPALFTTNP